MAISVVEPVGRAWDRTRQMLFAPFDIIKWFILGFTAWLAYLGEEGGGFNPTGLFNMGSSSGSRSGSGEPGPSVDQMFAQAMEWLQTYLVLILVLMIVVCLLAFVIYVVWLWLTSRGKFMFLDNVARNQAAVIEPWRRYKAAANNLMWFKMTYQLVWFNVYLLWFILAVAIMWADLRTAWPTPSLFSPGAPTIIAAIFFVLSCLTTALVQVFCSLCIEDFVIPLMYQRDLKAWPACKVFMATMLRGHLGTFILYALMKMLLNMGCAMIVGSVGCITCCITCGIAWCFMAMPYIGAVVILPVTVFMRCYALFFYEQFGPPFRIFVDLAPRGGFPVILNPPAQS